ncbi:hypothetical protein QZH56_24365 [Streptomyces olivoreticuli]|uniref:hypothetical protein n=1 Tax=Streptomyces olivoreticuli TaxID=68246 RepID=UPI002659F251|nr:hypothetical protein [Streptomyces olivoreticuli]WKK21933.1 hypothetical protein QZH56_24365 [Streptomyces olivoreticuli]
MAVHDGGRHLWQAEFGELAWGLGTAPGGVDDEVRGGVLDVAAGAVAEANSADACGGS